MTTELKMTKELKKTTQKNKKLTLQDYINWSKEFNQLSFIEKIKVLKKHPDLLSLGCDGNWWGVKVKDKEIQEELEDDEKDYFYIEGEWGWREMESLLELIGVEVGDL